jgi:hypothetical protein
MFIFAALFALVFIQIQAREHHFALHYELKCHLEGNGTYRCEGKASSNDIKTRIHGSGEVNAEVHKYAVISCHSVEKDYSFDPSLIH